MRIRTRLAFWHTCIVLVGLMLVGGAVYFEMVIEHPGMTQVLMREGHTPLEELGEIMLYGGGPALVLVLVGGWVLMALALRPVTALTRAVEQVHSDNLGAQLARSNNGDEIDRLTEVFNSMTARLNDSFTRVREFTLHASHELKTPLTLMRAELESAVREGGIGAAQREVYSSQIDEIERLTRIVDGLAFLAKADAGLLGFKVEDVRLDELVRDSFADAQVLGLPRNITVTLASAEEVRVKGDRHRLRQLLLNLTDNAVKYSETGGRVEIGLTNGGGAAELRISNTGAGIAPENLRRVFERFFRGQPADSGSDAGCGLGLSIVQWIVKAHRGEIGLTSDPGRETIVTVRLPAMAAGANRP